MSWSRGRIIGRGSAAVVSLATCCSSGTTFAAKYAEASRSESLQNEAGILSSLNSAYIVGYRGCDFTRDEGGAFLFNLFLEYAPDGSLSDVIRKRGGLDEAVVARYARQILAGIDYLHSRGIVHCDLKPGNVLVGVGDCMKIADFGCAKRVEEDTGKIAGTPMYMAPEVARGEEQGRPADVWAFGCTVIEMASGRYPWAGVCDPVSVIHRIVYSGETPEIPSLLSLQAKDFLERCLRRCPNERWTAGQLLNHPFLRQVSHGIVSKQVEEFPSPTSVMDRKIWELVEATGNATTRLSENGDSMNERIQKLSDSGVLLQNWSSDCNDSRWINVREEEEDVTMSDSDERPVTATAKYGNIPAGIGIHQKLLGRSCSNRERSSRLRWRLNGIFERCK